MRVRGGFLRRLVRAAGPVRGGAAGVRARGRLRAALHHAARLHVPLRRRLGRTQLQPAGGSRSG
ncbi:hypothetical protein JYU34_010694 [Plutella xylostella]|uniref:Uncharacterized protein n=1 Tax=Plutella xylostella TaxID=51655 RepID=A0ABQ7QFR1_PLUXY|nr:hypothetical protein JYU34_010694 [Plutella xylostella]